MVIKDDYLDPFEDLKSRLREPLWGQLLIKGRTVNKSRSWRKYGTGEVYSDEIHLLSGPELGPACETFSVGCRKASEDIYPKCKKCLRVGKAQGLL